MKAVVIGASLHGLPVAKELKVKGYAVTVLERHPHCIGGVWADDVRPPWLISNTPACAFQYGDLKLKCKHLVGQAKDRVLGSDFFQYLQEYAADLLPLIKFGSTATRIQRDGIGWSVEYSTLDGDDSVSTLIQCDKLVVATGLFSDASYPSFAHSFQDRPNVFHSKDLGKSQRREYLMSLSKIAIIGGGKSAMDIAAWLANETKAQVLLVMRTAPWITAGSIAGMSEQWSSCTRLGASFTPFFCDPIHSPSFDRRESSSHAQHIQLYWKQVEQAASRTHDYDRTGNGKLLRPYGSAFEGSAALFPPTEHLFDHVHAGRIKVVRGNISSLKDDNKQVVLQMEDGSELVTEGVIFATGYKMASMPFFQDIDLRAELGLTVTLDESSIHCGKAIRQWKDAIFQQLQILCNLKASLGSSRQTASLWDSSMKTSPFCLYRRMVPPSDSDRNIAFAGLVATLSTPLVAQLQAAWIADYFSDPSPLILGTKDEMHEEIAAHQAWSATRYGTGQCKGGTIMAMDYIHYLDLLMRDMRLETKRRSRITDWIGTYGGQQYTNLRSERARRNAKIGTKSKT